MVVAHHSIAAGGQHPRSTLRTVARQAGGWCPVTPVVGALSVAVRPCLLGPPATIVGCQCQVPFVAVVGVLVLVVVWS